VRESDRLADRVTLEEMLTLSRQAGSSNDGYADKLPIVFSGS
jgi:hypothetical protein